MGFFLGNLPHLTPQIGSTKYDLEVAGDPAARSDGLSGRDGMAAGKGMLFSFEKSEKQCMWMKDMHFSLDMIWLNTDKQVIQIVPDISPDTYPRTFCSGQPAQFVIELNAGQTAGNGLQVGQQLKF